jgi:hypothetical protein
MFPVFVYRISSENQDIVDICRNKVVKIFAENLVYKLLKRGRGIGQIKWGNQPFKQAISGSKSRYSFFSFGNADLMERVHNIKFYKLRSFTYIFQSFVN